MKIFTCVILSFITICYGNTAKEEGLKDLVSIPAETLSKAPIRVFPAYDQLPISVEEKQKIGEILTTMAENNVVKLLFEKKHLERLGHEINHVHPIRFLGTVFNDPRLINCLYRIRKSSFKWDGFIDGFGERLRQESKAGNVNAYIKDFSSNLNVLAEDVQAYCNYNDFEGLVLYLMEKSRRSN